MDTEAFLVKRERLISRLEERRVRALEAKASQKKSLFDLPWGELPGLLFAMGGNSGASVWLPRILLSTVAPVLLAFLRRKGLSFLQRKSRWSQFLDFLPLSRFGFKRQTLP